MELANQKEAYKAALASFYSIEQLYNEATIQLNESTIDYYEFLRFKELFQNADIELIQAKYRVKMTELIVGVAVQR